jgi:hypothetical protein
LDFDRKGDPMLSTGKWQDYRGKDEGVLIHLSCSKFHNLPIRDTLDGAGHPILDPNYDSGTYGIIQCVEAKTRLAAYKNRRRYFLFGTRYQGQNQDYQGKFLIVGLMRLEKQIEVRKRHVHQWMEQNTGPAPECMDMEACYAFQSSELNFYALEDCFELGEGLMKEWGYKGKITKQMKLTFSEERLASILDHFKEKTPANEAYQTALAEAETAATEAKRKAEEAAAEDAW